MIAASWHALFIGVEHRIYRVREVSHWTFDDLPAAAGGRELQQGIAAARPNKIHVSDVTVLY